MVLNNSHPSGYEVVCHCGLICISLMTNDVLLLCVCIGHLCILSLGETSPSSLPVFQLGLVVDLFFIQSRNHLPHMICRYFLPLHGLFFHSLDSVMCPVMYFFFCCLCFGVVTKK